MDIIVPSSDSDDDVTWCDEELTGSVHSHVKFNDVVQFIPILNELEWWANYEEARRGHWLIDAARFRHRIRVTEDLIGWIFSIEHRAVHINRTRK